MKFQHVNTKYLSLTIHKYKQSTTAKSNDIILLTTILIETFWVHLIQISSSATFVSYFQRVSAHLLNNRHVNFSFVWRLVILILSYARY